MLNKKGQLIIITAPSGAGKTTLIKKLCKNSNYQLSISYTTREPRKGEVDGKDYHFISVDKFKEKIENGDFAEWAKVHNNFYGTDREESYKIIETKKSVIFDIDYQGALNLQKVFPEALSIFILTPTLKILESRLRGRETDSEETINIRVKNAVHEIEFIEKFDYLLLNDDFDKAFENLKILIEANRYSISKNGEKLSKFVKSFLGE